MSNVLRSVLARLFLIEADEYQHVRYFILFNVLLGCGMAVGRATTDALFFKRYGIEYLPMMYVIVSVFLALSSIAYAAYSDRISPERFFRIILGALIAILFVNWAVMAFSPWQAIYPIYFLVYEITSEVLLVHVALYIAHNFLPLQSQRLNPLIFAGTQVGVILGGLLVATTSQALGVQNLLLIWCVLLTLSLVALAWWHRTHGASPYYRAPARRANQMKQSWSEITQGLKLMRTSPLLRAGSMALFFMVITFYVLCYSVNRIYTQTFASEESLSAFLGGLTAANSAVALSLQLFVTNRLIRKVGIKKVNLLFPITTMASFGALLITFTLPAALVGSFNKDAIMTAFRNPVRTLFFAALPDNVQGRARSTSVAFVLPVALSVAGVLLWLMQRLDNPLYFIVFGLCTASAYLFYNHKMNKSYVAEMLVHLRQKLIVTDEQRDFALHGSDEDVVAEIKQGIMHDDPQVCIAFARIAMRSFPEEAAGLILERTQSCPDTVRDQLFHILADHAVPEMEARLLECLPGADDHLRATILETLASFESGSLPELLPEALASESPRVRVAAIRAVIEGDYRQYRDNALAEWSKMLGADDLGSQLAALGLHDLIARSPELGAAPGAACMHLIERLLEGESRRARLQAMKALAAMSPQEASGVAVHIRHSYASPDIELRLASVACVHLLPIAEREEFLSLALEDANPRVCNAAAEALAARLDHAAETFALRLENNSAGSPRAQRALLESLHEMGSPPAVFTRIAVCKADTAYILSRARSLLERSESVSSAVEQVMLHTLRERIRQYVDLALLALKRIERTEDIEVVRAAIQSDDQRHIARACEVIRHMRTAGVTTPLTRVLQGAQRSVAKESSTGALPFQNICGMLLWCSTHQDPWLKECASASLQNRPG